MSEIENRLKNLQETAIKKAGNAPLKEGLKDIPKDVDENRLREIAAELGNTLAEGENSKKTLSDEIPKTEFPQKLSSISEGEILVLSVTTIPFVPSKASSSEDTPSSTQKFQILVETLQPLQLGKKYKLVL